MAEMLNDVQNFLESVNNKVQAHELLAACGIRNDSHVVAEANCEDAKTTLQQEAQEFLSHAAKKRQHIFLMSQPGIGKTTMVQKLLNMLKEHEGDGVEVAGFYTEEVRDGSGRRFGFDVVRVGGANNTPSRSALARIGQTQPRVGKYTVDVSAFDAFALPALEQPCQEAALPENPRLYTALDGSVEAVQLIGERSQESGGGFLIMVPSSGKEVVVDDVSQLQAVPPNLKANASDSPEPTACQRLCVCDEVGKMELLSLRFGPALLGALDSGAVVLGTLPQPVKGQRDPEIVEKVKRRADVRLVRITRGNRDALVSQVYTSLRESLSLGPPGTSQPRPVKRKHPEASDKPATSPEESTTAGTEAKTEKDILREKRKAAKAKEAAKRELAAKIAREKRKARAAARSKAREAANEVMEVEDEEFSDAVEDAGDVDDEGGVEAEDLDAIVDVESAKVGKAMPPARKLHTTSSVVQSSVPKPKGASRQTIRVELSKSPSGVVCLE